MESAIPPKAGLCIFCGSRDLTREHVWPRWVRDALYDGRRLLTTKHSEHGSVVRTQWEFEKLDVTVKAVCRGCNNGWMAALEGRAKPVLKPMILGQPTHLDPTDQAIATTWMTKTALVLQHFYRSDCPFPDKDYRTIRQSESPLPDSVAFMGAYRVNRHAVSNTSFLIPELDGYSSAGNVGALVWRVAVGRELATFGGPFIEPMLEPYFVQVWPVQGAVTVSWPPERILEDEGLDAVIGGSDKAWSNDPP